MSKHHDWTIETPLIVKPFPDSDVYICSKCKLKISAFERVRWKKQKYECQPRHVEKGKFKRNDTTKTAKMSEPEFLEMQENFNKIAEQLKNYKKDCHLIKYE